MSGEISINHLIAKLGLSIKTELNNAFQECGVKHYQ